MLQIINAALLAQGQEVVSENDGSIEWRVIATNWPLVVEAELEDANFHFSKEEQTLVTRTDGQFDFDDAYQVPAAALHVRNVWVETNGVRHDVDWVQDATHIHVDATDGIVVEYAMATDPAIWTAGFSRAIQLRFEAIILRSLKEEYREAEAFDAKADEQLQRARSKSASSRSKGAPLKGSGSILNARRGRG